VRYTPGQLSEVAENHPSDIEMAFEDFDFKKTHEEACGKGVCGDGFGRLLALCRNWVTTVLHRCLIRRMSGES